MVGRELWINSAYFSERAENKRIDGTQTATWRVVLSEGVMTARLFFTFSAVVKIYSGFRYRKWSNICIRIFNYQY